MLGGGGGDATKTRAFFGGGGGGGVRTDKCDPAEVYQQEPRRRAGRRSVIGPTISQSRPFQGAPVLSLSVTRGSLYHSE